MVLNKLAWQNFPFRKRNTKEKPWFFLGDIAEVAKLVNARV